MLLRRGTLDHTFNLPTTRRHRKVTERPGRDDGRVIQNVHEKLLENRMRLFYFDEAAAFNLPEHTNNIDVRRPPSSLREAVTWPPDSNDDVLRELKATSKCRILEFPVWSR
jgi:hypothetical protein